MNKLVLSCLLAALLCIVHVAAFISPDAGFLHSERRHMAPYPDPLPKMRSRYVKQYFRGIDAFFADRFPLRASLLALSVGMHAVAGDNLNMDKCYAGKESWLFLGNSLDRCTDKLQGIASITEYNLERQAQAYEGRRDAANSLGAEFLLFIGPDKPRIYPEYLPPVISPAKRRFISPLLDALDKAGIKVYDPTARLIEEKPDGLLYYRTDTHWNARGAYVAFDGFREWAGLPELPPLSLVKAPAHAGDLIGSSGYADFPISAGDNFTLQWNVPPSLQQEDNLISNSGAASGKTVWIFGDSFAEALKPYIAATFKTVRFFKHDEFKDVVSSQLPHPDIVLWIIVERRFAKAD